VKLSDDDLLHYLNKIESVGLKMMSQQQTFHPGVETAGIDMV